MFKFFKEKLQTLFKTDEKEEKIAKQVNEKLAKKQEKVKRVKEKKSKELKQEIKEVIEEAKEELVEKENIKEAIKEELPKEHHLKLNRDEKKSSFFDRFRKQKENEKEEEVIEKQITEEKVKEGLISKIQAKFNTVKIDQKTFNEFFEELELLLIENNVALPVVDKIRENMEKSLVNIEVKKDQIEKEIKNALKESILELLISPFDIIEKIKNKEGTFIILFFGINGSGKTTSISKLAHLLQKNKISSVFAAADTFRAASIEQLSKHGEKLGIKVIHQDYGADPSAVAFDAIKYAQAHQIKVVLIDTAGRMHTKDNLLKEMEKIIRVTKPDLKIFVAESITGNDATEQAKIFNETAGIDGTILTKSDVDEKGGTAISIGHITNKPILFLGTGQEYKDLIKFDPKEIIANLGLD
jgi:fused signal recognition particle receptor